MTAGSYNRAMLPRPRHSPAAAATRRPAASAALATLCLAVALSGCGLFSNQPSPSPVATPSGPAATPSSVDASQVATTPSPTSRPVRSIALVADVGESQKGTASAVVWLGVEQVAADLGAVSSMKVPTSLAELSTQIQATATTSPSIVVTVGAQAAAATWAAALANPSVQFFTLDQAGVNSAPPNLHAIVFDEAEIGYLAGVTAASLSRTGRVGFVGDDDSSPATANYAAGFRNGALYAEPSVAVAIAYAGTSPDPAKGRAAAAGLVTAQADVIATGANLSGIGAMREACRRGASVVALDTDAWLLIPDVNTCLVTSVRKLYDVAITSAIRRYSDGLEVPGLVLSDVAGGGIGLSDFHVAIPATVTARLDRVVGDMRVGPPRPTVAPSAEASGATVVPSSEPSGATAVPTGS